MAYSDFTTLQKLSLELGISHRRQRLFADVRPVEPSAKVEDDLQDAQEHFSLTTEKAKSEFLIAPILREVRRNNPNKIAVFSGVNLDLPENNLSGFCDFILSKVPDSVELTAPIFCLVEAKNRTLEEGFAQCAAEMYAAVLFNRKHQSDVKTLYGCVTNGFEWCFLRLDGQLILIDLERYFLNDLPNILGVFQEIVAQ